MRKRQTYSTVTVMKGMEFKRITETVSKMGWKMNYSSARNWLLRGMKKMARELAKASGAHLTETQLEEMARNSLFQSAVGDLLEKADTYKEDGMASKNVSGRASPTSKADVAGVDDADGTENG